MLVKRDPAHLTLEFIKADREGRILIDVGRNGPGATFAAAYALRARRGAPVSAPCTWPELEHGEVAPQTFKLEDDGASGSRTRVTSGRSCTRTRSPSHSRWSTSKAC